VEHGDFPHTCSSDRQKKKKKKKKKKKNVRLARQQRSILISMYRVKRGHTYMTNVSSVSQYVT
jgi:hypothetical protein